MKNTTLIMIVLVIVVGAAGFFGGMQYQKSQRSSFAGQFGGAGNGTFGSRTGTGRNGARPVNGDILNSDDKSITVKLADGSTMIVLVTSSTTINKATTATKSDLTTGVKVAAFGTTNSDGTMTATNIQINPMMRGQGAGSGTPNPSQPSTTP